MSSSIAAIIKEANATLIAEGNLDAVANYFTPDYAVHLTEKTLSGGHTSIKGALSMLLRAFSQIDVDVEVLLEQDDRIAWQRTLTAIHSGTYKGFPASGRKLLWREMVVSQFQGSLIAEEWLSTDLAEQLLLSRKHK